MGLQAKLEKTARSVSRIGGLVGETLSSFLPISNSNVYFNITDDKPYTLVVAESSAQVVEGKENPITLEIKGTKPAFMRWFNGEKTFESQWVNGELEIVCPRNNLLKALIIGMLVGM